MERGLEGRFRVEKIDDPTDKHAACRYFVLDPQHDPGAREALSTYAAWASSRGYGALASDLTGWLDEVQANNNPEKNLKFEVDDPRRGAAVRRQVRYECGKGHTADSPTGCDQCEDDARLATEWRKAWNDGEAEGQRGIIRQVHEAIAHLNPPDTGMGVFELIEWALDRARSETPTPTEETADLTGPEQMAARALAEETAEVADEDREALADVIARALDVSATHRAAPIVMEDRVTDAILTSDWLRDLIAAAITANAKAEVDDLCARLAKGVDDLPRLTEGPLRAGTSLWPECDRDAYSLAIEEAQTVFRAALADPDAAGEGR